MHTKLRLIYAVLGSLHSPRGVLGILLEKARHVLALDVLEQLNMATKVGAAEPEHNIVMMSKDRAS